MFRAVLCSACLACLAPVAATAQAPAHDLFAAIRANDGPAFSNALQRAGTGLADAALEGHVTPLHLAAALDRRSMAAALITRGAWVDAPTEGGFTPLHWAAAMDAAGVVELLISLGADIGVPAHAGITPLHWAGARNATNCVAALIRAGGRLDARTDRGMTPLHWAVSREAEDAAVMLAFRAVETGLDRLAPPPPARREPPAPPPTNGVAAAHLPQPDRPPDLGRPGDPPIVMPPRPEPPAQGDIHTVPLGKGQALSFVWLPPAGAWFGRFEVTNGQFRRFRPAHTSGARGELTLDTDSQPVVMVSWHDAMAFCAWINTYHRTSLPAGTSCRLPTDREWRVAARCGTDRRYPWGHAWPPQSGNHADESTRAVVPGTWRGIEGYDDGFSVTCPVTLSGANAWGIHGLAGNVWEWCDDWYDASQQRKVRQGGGWAYETRESLAIDFRGFDDPDARYDTIGFRVVLAPTDT